MSTSLEWKVALAEEDLPVDTARQEENRNTSTIMEETSDQIHEK